MKTKWERFKRLNQWLTGKSKVVTPEIHAEHKALKTELETHPEYSRYFRKQAKAGIPSTPTSFQEDHTLENIATGILLAEAAEGIFGAGSSGAGLASTIATQDSDWKGDGGQFAGGGSSDTWTDDTPTSTSDPTPDYSAPTESYAPDTSSSIDTSSSFSSDSSL